MNTLTIKELTKNFNGKTILNKIGLISNKGEIISIIGPSGGGKSTLLKCIAGLEVPTSGSIERSGTVGMVFQQFNLFNNLTVLNNICLPLRLIKKESRQQALKKAEMILEKVGLGDKKGSYPIELSGGQAQRAAIARTLVMDPELILFDEPTSSLDPSLKKEVLDLIKIIAKEKQSSILLVTHEVSFARSISDRVVKLIEGSLIE